MALGVSDKALLRFLELGGDVDVETLRKRLTASLIRAHVAARRCSASDYLIKADGLIYVVRGETVVTVTEHKESGGRAGVLTRT